MTSQLPFLHNSLKVTPLDDDLIQVTVTLPSDHYLHFARLLDSLTGFAQLINRQIRVERAKAAVDSEEWQQQAKLYKDQYHTRLVELFDHYTDKGFNRTAAIKAISADLRKDNHPWSSPDLVRPSLREAGRPGRIGRPRRQRS